jgi:hypothetical protein
MTAQRVTRGAPRQLGLIAILECRSLWSSPCCLARRPTPPRDKPTRPNPPSSWSTALSRTPLPGTTSSVTCRNTVTTSTHRLTRCAALSATRTTYVPSSRPSPAQSCWSATPSAALSSPMPPPVIRTSRTWSTSRPTPLTRARPWGSPPISGAALRCCCSTLCCDPSPDPVQPMRMLYIDPAFFHDVFAQDLPAKQTAVMAAELRPSALSPAGDTLRCAGMEVDSFVVPRRPR